MCSRPGREEVRAEGRGTLGPTDTLTSSMKRDLGQATSPQNCHISSWDRGASWRLRTTVRVRVLPGRQGCCAQDSRVGSPPGPADPGRKHRRACLSCLGHPDALPSLVTAQSCAETVPRRDVCRLTQTRHRCAAGGDVLFGSLASLACPDLRVLATPAPASRHPAGHVARVSGRDGAAAKAGNILVPSGSSGRPRAAMAAEPPLPAWPPEHAPPAGTVLQGRTELGKGKCEAGSVQWRPSSRRRAFGVGGARQCIVIGKLVFLELLERKFFQKNFSPLLI